MSFKIGIVIVCTNAYFILGIRFIKKFIHYYIGKSTIQFYLFTDTDPRLYAPNITNITYIHTTHSNWVDGTNSKFKNILSLDNEECDYLFYFDADTNISKEFTEEWFIGDVVGGEHFNNCDTTNGKLSEKPYDRNPLSRAYIPNDTLLKQTYYYGAFFGGKKDRVIDFCNILYNNQEQDKLIPYEPCWNDESYINHYFHYHPPTFTVPANKFMFVISDKGGLGETRNTRLDIEKYKEMVLNNNLQIFDFNDTTVIFYNYVDTGIMYGPWIAEEKKVQSIQYLMDGEQVYMIVDGIHTKMVTKTGVAKYYVGKMSDFNIEKWHEYSNAGDNYRLTFYG